uniref:Ig-like domain-containing protein n=1 Tax=Sinocyclocheilus grahami TaxID=75366 RepID=A0A672QJ77_SINGR
EQPKNYIINALCCIVSIMGGDDVVQEPKIIWEPKNGSTTLNCKHNKGISYYQMYWYRQRPGETMRLIVFTTTGSKPDFGDVDEKKFEAQKSDAESGSLKVKDLEPDDSGTYFCAVSEHCVKGWRLLYKNVLSVSRTYQDQNIYPEKLNKAKKFVFRLIQHLRYYSFPCVATEGLATLPVDAGPGEGETSSSGVTLGLVSGCPSIRGF